MDNKQLKYGNLYILIAIIFSAFIMRSPITGVGSLVGMIKGDLGLSNTMAGLVTTIPLLAFAVVSPFVSKLNNKIGAGWLMISASFTLLIGMLIRSYVGVVGFFIGTVIIGIGIAIINVMLPSISRSYFPSKFGIVTSTYVTIMSIMGALAVGISFPLAVNAGWGWRNVLSLWGGVSIISIFTWLSQRKLMVGQGANVKTADPTPIAQKKIFKSSVAWWLSIYTGFQSLLFYCFVAWLPTILQTKGLSEETAGYYASVFQLAGILSSFVLPLIAARRKDQKILVSALALIYVIALIIAFKTTVSGFLFIVVIAVSGFCAAGGISLSMLFIGLRSTGPEEAAKLSGMSQSIGYALATFGPIAIGRLSDMTGSWSVPISCLIIITVFQVFIGYKTGENRTV